MPLFVAFHTQSFYEKSCNDRKIDSSFITRGDLIRCSSWDSNISTLILLLSEKLPIQKPTKKPPKSTTKTRQHNNNNKRQSHDSWARLRLRNYLLLHPSPLFLPVRHPMFPCAPTSGLSLCLLLEIRLQEGLWQGEHPNLCMWWVHATCCLVILSLVPENDGSHHCCLGLYVGIEDGGATTVLCDWGHCGRQ